MFTAQVESLTDTLEEMKPHFFAHYEELALDKDHVPLSPQYSEYLARDAAGMVCLVTLRKDGALCGYIVSFIAPGLHYSTCLTAIMDIIRVTDAARGDGAGALKLMRTYMRETRRRGVKRWFMGKKVHAAIDVGRLYEAFGFKPVEVMYSRFEE